MRLRPGLLVKIKTSWVRYSMDTRAMTSRKEAQGVDFRVVQLIKPSRGTEYTSSDWIVAKPELAANPKNWYGIGREQIIEVAK